MKKERTIITQDLCDHVKILLAGGANLNKAAEITKTGHATISRIKAAGYDAEVYKQNTEKQRKKEKKEEGQLQGQMEMELPETPEKQELPEQVKLMRFMAGQDEKMMKFQQAKVNELIIQQAMWIDDLVMKIDRLNDTLCQILRAIRKE